MAKSISYEEILARRKRRKDDEERRAHKRTPIPATNQSLAWTILILEWAKDVLYEQWRAEMLAEAQKNKIVLPPGRGPRKRGTGKRGGRRNPVFEALGLD